MTTNQKKKKKKCFAVAKKKTNNHPKTAPFQSESYKILLYEGKEFNGDILKHERAPQCLLVNISYIGSAI